VKSAPLRVRHGIKRGAVKSEENVAGCDTKVDLSRGVSRENNLRAIHFEGLNVEITGKFGWFA